MTAPLKALGYSLNSVDPTELGEARELLRGLAPHVLALDSDTYEEKLRTEEAVLGLTWTGGIDELRRRGGDRRHEVHRARGRHPVLDGHLGHPRPRAPSRGGVRVPQLHPRAGHPGQGDGDQLLRHAQRRGQEARRPGASSTTRPSSSRTRRSPTSRARTTSRPTRSASRSGRSSSRTSAAEPDGAATSRHDRQRAGRAHSAGARRRGRSTVRSADRPARAAGDAVVRHPARPAAGHRRSSSPSGCAAETGGYAGGFTFDNYVAVFAHPDPFITSLTLAAAGHGPVPARRPAPGLLHRHPGRRPQGPVHRPAGHPVLDELPHPDLRLAADPRARRASPGSSATTFGIDGFRILGTRVRRPDRPRLRLPAAHGLPAVRDPRADGPDARRGVQGPRRRALGDLPPDHPADRPARPHHRQHPRLHPDDGRVRHPPDPRLRPGLHDGQRPRPALPRGPQLAGRIGLRGGASSSSCS